jgi:serine/threonine-protein kinase RsbT
LAQPDEESLALRATLDVERARRLVRAFALRAGLPEGRANELVLAVSELADNAVRYSQEGGTLTCSLRGSPAPEVQVIVEDSGPGIEDVERAMQEGYSTSGGLGSGLPGARRLVDSFEIESGPGGTRVRVAKRAGP